MLTRGESITAGSSLTALVPMSVTEEEGEPTSLGSQVAPHLQSLPIGEPNALMRLHQVAYATQAHKDTGRAVGARSLSDIAGFAPTTLHALGVRVSAEVMRKPHDILITNVPGPQLPLYAAGSELVASYPVLPLSAGHLLTIGVTSYNGDVFFGLTADRYAIRDVEVLAQCLRDALEELLDTTVRADGVRQPTRKASPAARRAAAKKAAARHDAARKATAQKRAAVRTLVNRATSRAATRPEPPSRQEPAAAPKPRKKAAAKPRPEPSATRPEPSARALSPPLRALSSARAPSARALSPPLRALSPPLRALSLSKGGMARREKRPRPPPSRGRNPRPRNRRTADELDDDLRARHVPRCPGTAIGTGPGHHPRLRGHRFIDHHTRTGQQHRGGRVRRAEQRRRAGDQHTAG